MYYSQNKMEVIVEHDGENFLVLETLDGQKTLILCSTELGRVSASKSAIWYTYYNIIKQFLDGLISYDECLSSMFTPNECTYLKSRGVSGYAIQ